MLINMLMKSLQDWNKIKTRIEKISLNRLLNKGKLNEGNEMRLLLVNRKKDLPF